MSGKVICHLFLIFCCLLVIRGFRNWYRQTPFNKEPNIEPEVEIKGKAKEFLKGLDFYTPPEYQQKQGEKIITVKAGFCTKHPQETQIVLGKKGLLGDCLSCKRGL